MQKQWRKGDLGRFSAESPKRPRFEVVGLHDQNHVMVWYGGADQPEPIPIKTFQRDCTDVWEIEALVKDIPPWVRSGTSFEFPMSGPFTVRQAEIADPTPLGQPKLITTRALTLNGQRAVIRSVRRDHVSCFIPEKRFLAIVPVRLVARNGIIRKSRWDVLGQLFEEEEEAEDLFKGL